MKVKNHANDVCWVSQLYFPSLLYITNNEQRKCEYRYLCSGGSRGGARGPEPLLIPTIIRPNWGQKNFFGDHPPPRHLSQGLDDRAPRYLKVWIRFYYVSFLLFTPRIKLPIKMTYHDVIRLQIVWIVGALATVHQLCRENYRKSIRPFSYLLV